LGAVSVAANPFRIAAAISIAPAALQMGAIHTEPCLFDVFEGMEVIGLGLSIGAAKITILLRKGSVRRDKISAATVSDSRCDLQSVFA
jgi:hypothetical protein